MAGDDPSKAEIIDPNANYTNDKLKEVDDKIDDIKIDYDANSEQFKRIPQSIDKFDEAVENARDLLDKLKSRAGKDKKDGALPGAEKKVEKKNDDKTGLPGEKKDDTPPPGKDEKGGEKKVGEKEDKKVDVKAKLGKGNYLSFLGFITESYKHALMMYVKDSMSKEGEGKRDPNDYVKLSVGNYALTKGLNGTQLNLGGLYLGLEGNLVEKIMKAGAKIGLQKEQQAHLLQEFGYEMGEEVIKKETIDKIKGLEDYKPIINEIHDKLNNPDTYAILASIAGEGLSDKISKNAKEAMGGKSGEDVYIMAKLGSELRQFDEQGFNKLESAKNLKSLIAAA